LWFWSLWFLWFWSLWFLRQLDGPDLSRSNIDNRRAIFDFHRFLPAFEKVH